MSQAARISPVGTRLGVRPRALAALGVLIAIVVVVAMATILMSSGSGVATQGNVAPDAGPYPGLAQQADQATRQPQAGAITHPRSVPPVRIAPSRGSAPPEPRN
jgi:hypothetical protein